MENIIKDFLRSSIKNDFSDFSFDEAFQEFEYYLKRNLTMHGFCEAGEFIDSYKEFINSDYINIDAFTLHTDYITIDKDDIFEIICKGIQDKLKENFKELKSYLIDLLERIENRPEDTPENLKDLIILFDECIHAQHETGYIVDDCNIEEIKEEIELEYKNNILVY